ncbi:MAG: dienelactone hydrolase family protein [Pseudomonadota bacterium]
MYRFNRARNIVVALILALLAGCSDDTPETASQAAPAPERQSASATPAAQPALLPEAMAVAAEGLPYGELEDGLLRGYFAYPEAMLSPLPGVILVHDWNGVDEATRAAAERIAGQGFMVLAVDLYGGQAVTDREVAGRLSRELIEAPEKVAANLAAAQRFLRDGAGAPSVGTFGWAMGGYWSFSASRLLPDPPAASVVLYGQVDQDAERLAALQAPVLTVFAENDPSMPLDMIRAYEAEGVAQGKTLEVLVVPETRAGFADTGNAAFDEAAAATAWAAVFSFLAEHLPRG